MELDGFNEQFVRDQALAAGFANVKMYVQKVLSTTQSGWPFRKASTLSMRGGSWTSTRSIESFAIATQSQRSCECRRH